ncbi:MAG: hypothetical protein ACSHW0_02135 [Thalassotalea sp.]
MKSLLINNHFTPRYLLARIVKPAVTLILFSSLFIGIASANNQWQPVASDTLIKLPAKIIHQRIQDDFSASPLAQKLAGIEQDLSQQANQIKSLQALKAKAADGEQAAIAFDIVEKKSSYLGLLKASHDLRQQALDKRQGLYETILGKINQQSNDKKFGDNYQVKAAQKAAQARMLKNQLKVEQTLNQYRDQQYQADRKNNLQANYQDDYQANLNKINQLKATLAKHSFNEKPEVDGVVVSDQEYIRSLLMKLATERSLLSQENTMLAYMTKLVGLDAESLTAQLAKNTQTSAPEQNQSYSRANQVADLFIDGE